jgi:hypothetical protein
MSALAQAWIRRASEARKIQETIKRNNGLKKGKKVKK